MSFPQPHPCLGQRGVPRPLCCPRGGSGSLFPRPAPPPSAWWSSPTVGPAPLDWRGILRNYFFIHLLMREGRVAPWQLAPLILPGPPCPSTYSFSSRDSPRKAPLRRPVILLLLKSLENRGEHRWEKNTCLLCKWRPLRLCKEQPHPGLQKTTGRSQPIARSEYSQPTEPQLGHVNLPRIPQPGSDLGSI